jgi:hypothetical protein
MAVESVSDRTASPGKLERVRVGAFYLVALASLGFAAAVVGDLLALLVVGWTPAVGAELGVHRLHLMGIAAAVAVTVLALASQLFRPRNGVAPLLLALVSTFVATVAMAATNNPHLVEPLTLFVFAGVLGILHPARRQLFSPGREFRPVLLGLVALAALPLAAYAVDQFALQASVADEHALDGHYAMMGTIALTLVAGGVIASLGTAGNRTAAWLVGLLAVYFGALSVGLPLQSSGVGLLWGGLAIAWGLGFVLAAELSRRADAPRFMRRPFASESNGPTV